MKNLLLAICVLGLAALAGCKKEKEPVDYVDTSVGTISHLLVPCKQLAHLPNSMMRAQPEKFDGAAMVIEGLPFFAHTHRFALPVRFNVYNENSRRDTYFIDREKATPYSYEVLLTDCNIGVKFGAGRRAALYNFDFSNSQKARRVFEIDAFNGIENASAKGAKARFIYLIGGVKAYVAAEFSQPVAELKIVSPKRALFIFDGSKKEIGMRYAVSFISFEKAQKSLKEISGFRMKPVLARARKAWNDALSAVKIIKADEKQKRLFYSAFYRALERPANFDEHGEYFNFYKNAPEKSLDGKYFFTDDWSWDTYRTAHPMRALLMPKTEFYCLESILRYAEANPKKWIPKFMSIDREYNHMNGNHIYGSFLDAYLKGAKNLDMKKLLKYALATVETKTLLAGSGAEAGELSQFYKKNGYIPAIDKPDQETCKEVPSLVERRQSVSVTTALAYDDWCIGKIAEIVGDKQTAEKFLARGENFKKLFDEKTKFFLPKRENGEFIRLTPAQLRGEGEKYKGDLNNSLRNMYYTENNAYVYRFDAEHATGELVKMFGGKKEFEKAIDEGFATPLRMWKYMFLTMHPDHTGIIGSNSVANEPAVRIPYLYNVAGAPWKTQRALRNIIDKLFRDDIMGIPGDEDGGAMTAFVMMTQLGIYPMNVGTPYYEFGTPFFEEAEIRFENGNTLRVLAKGTSSTNKYVRSIKVNGKPHNKTWIAHSELVNAKTIEFEMSDTPVLEPKLEPSPY